MDKVYVYLSPFSSLREEQIRLIKEKQHIPEDTEMVATKVQEKGKSVYYEYSWSWSTKSQEGA